MKHLSSITVSLLAISVTGPYTFAQDCNVYNIKTAVTAPAVNTQRPAKTNTFNRPLSQYALNSLYFPGTNTIESPFFQGNNTNVTQLVLNQDMKAEDGWEPIRRDFGYRTTATRLRKAFSCPGVLLYNKRTGILRVPYARGELNATYQTTFISLSWDQASPYQTPTLDYAKALVPLGKPFTTNSFFQRPSFYVNAS